MKINSLKILVLLSIIILPACNNWSKETPDEKLRTKAVKICKSNIILDSHIDWPERMNEAEDLSGRTEKGDFDYVRAREGGLDAAFSVVYISSRYGVDEGRVMVDSILNYINRYPIQHPDKFATARTPDDVRKNFSRGVVSLPLCLENGSPVGDDPGYLKYLKDQGIVYITLNHDRANQISDSNFDPERKWNGLSPFGIEVIEEMNRLGIIIDISHSTDSTVFQALRLSSAPIVATHSLCRSFVPGFERNLSDTLIKAIADRRGVIMVNFGSFFLDTVCNKNWTYLFHTWQDSTGISLESEEGAAFVREYAKTHRLFSDAAKVADHIDHIVSIAGIDCVGIGTDFDGIGAAKPADLPDVSAYPALVFELLKRGYAEADIKKILSENYLRVWDEVIKTGLSMN
jgi:membrane dipeptidase